MKREFVILYILVAVGGPPALRGDDFRIEWISGKPIETLKFDAGANVLRLCSITRPKRCIVVQPRGSARCARSGGFIMCNAAGVKQQFQKFTATSASGFHLEATLPKSANGEVRRPGQVRAVDVRAAEVRAAPKGLRVVLPVDLETYVAGVLAGEAGTMKSSPALCAMAVVARTWALRWRGRHRREGFDFCSLTHCQVFDPPAETENDVPTAISRAVQETRGKVLKFHGQLIDVYFSADCGGITEAAADVWPDRAAPYLRSIADPYCGGSEHSSWQQTLSLATVSAILHDDVGVQWGGPLRDLKVEQRDASGRAHTLRLESNTAPRVDANEFRYAVDRRLGWNTIKSNLYTLQRRGDSLVFTGRGLGHGVGLCQAGAEQMGQRNISSEKILATYFPGVTISEIAPAAGSDPILSSEHFQLVFPDNQEPWANKTLIALEAVRRETENWAGALPAKVQVETFATTPDFIHAANQPGWTAASTDGISIELQPLSTLDRKGILVSTLRHELAHLAVHRERSPGIPRWFEEGLVLYLTGEQVSGDSRFDFHGRSLEESVSKPRSEAEMKAAYALSLSRVRNLARERGHAALWQILKHPSASDIRWLKKQK
ncbi:MAG: SpoIID/LytB domain-containing protein [Terriglobia bacterium]